MELLYFIGSALLPFLMILTPSVRRKWRFLLKLVRIHVVLLIGVYLFVWYNKIAGYQDWIWANFLYIPVNIVTFCIYVGWWGHTILEAYIDPPAPRK